MEVIINKEKRQLTSTGKFGGEGELWTTNVEGVVKCVKVYNPDKRTAFNERKVITLINRNQKFLLGIENFVAFPEAPVYEVGTKHFCGFMMRYYPNHLDLNDIKYSSNGLSYGRTNLVDENLLSIVHALNHYLEVFHKVGVVVGDINPENILINEQTLAPVLVDFDSVQVGGFFSTTRRKEYVDPTVKTDGKGRARFFLYNTDSDIYAMAVVAFELLVGVKPHFYQTTDPTDTDYKKNLGVSWLDFVLKNQSKIENSGLNIERNPLFDAVSDRLQYLSENCPDIFKYFEDVFVKGERKYYYHGPRSTVYIQRRKIKSSENEFELLGQDKNDPEEVKLFMDQYGLKIP
ncbi:MAG: hypothetical protein K9J17_05575 [Flavobacteriales bacterium]|nr:hypothetical protein [Flavobacteriales bacterium]